MSINITLLGEMLTFAVLVWAMVKFVWPPLTKMLEERQEKIAKGLEDARRGEHQLELAKKNISKQLQNVKKQASTILDQANQQATTCIEDGKATAQAERSKILAQAKLNIEQETNKAKKELQTHIVDLVLATTEKVLEQEIDEKSQRKLIDKLIASI